MMDGTAAPQHDAVLDILQPLFSVEGSNSIKTISETRKKLERAVKANKVSQTSVHVGPTTDLMNRLETIVL